jgi:hypothetical protein
MRKTKRFTPQVLARFERQERSVGIYEDHTAWHQVSRGDPSSHGRSHLLNLRNRIRDLLSDGEYVTQLFATMLPSLDDSLEQRKLPTHDEVHLMVAYGNGDPFQLFPGTERLAAELGIKHPKIGDAKETVPWTASTDLVLVFKPPGGVRHMLAIAFKPVDWNKTKRTIELLRLEREFWLCRQVPWLLITPKQYDDAVFNTLLRVACWALVDEVPKEYRQLACRIATQHSHSSVTDLLYRISAFTPSFESAQRALWQAIWVGELPIDLRRGWRPHVPLKHISYDAFMQLNPIAARRTAWT